MQQTRHDATLSAEWPDGISAIDPGEWRHLHDGDNPFLSHEFLAGLEQHDCLAAHGWYPSPLILRASGRTVGAAPLYLRADSTGEFVFDWAWADAWQRAGGRYYPKLVCAVPFTPVRGPRLLAAEEFRQCDVVRGRLLAEILDLCRRNGLSSFHCLFPEPDDARMLQQSGLLLRRTPQFHWHNRGYRDFQDFLDALDSKRRKQIRRERRDAVKGGIEVELLHGAAISDAQWRTFHEFYSSTFHRRWGRPRLTADFMQWIGRSLPEQVVLLLARRGRRYIAGALALQGGDTLYGRHWGCAEEQPFLHFELCYYQTIDYCIGSGLQRLDAGVQGEHKLSRGFEPVTVDSGHWLAHSGFRDAVSDFLCRETPQVDAYIRDLRQHLPYRAGIVPGSAGEGT
jgi:predicted N-acyltransferase